VEEVVINVEKIVQEIFSRPDVEELDKIIEGEVELWGGSYRKVPYWRCQPYFRPVNGVTGDKRVTQALKSPVEVTEDTSGKRAAEDELIKEPKKQQIDV
jgi:tRNA-dihydrouridine synthase 1